MKNSGIEWIGEIPDAWEVVLLSSLFEEHKEKNIGMKCSNLLSLSYGKIKRKNIDAVDGLLPESFEGYNVIDDGDIVLRLTDLQNDQRSLRTGLCHERGIVTSAYVTLRKRNAELNSTFLHYYLHSFDVRKGFYGMGSGVRQGLNFDGIRKLEILIPPTHIQERIVDFLENKLSQVEELIANQEKQIEKLKEYKQSVITEAVTKGLDKSTPMKDSGIEWIGEIPESWGTVLLSSLFVEHKCKNTGMQCNNLLSLSYGKIKRKDINGNDGLLPESFEGYNIISEGDIVLRLTDLQNDQRSLRTGLCPEEGIVTSAYVTLRKRNNNLSPQYMHYFLHSFDVNKGFYAMGSGVRQGLNYEGIRKLELLFPTIEEQFKIVAFLNKKCSQIEQVIKLKEEKIEKLQEYKKSLIYEYVTGKKEVV